MELSYSLYDNDRTFELRRLLQLGCLLRFSSLLRLDWLLLHLSNLLWLRASELSGERKNPLWLPSNKSPTEQSWTYEALSWTAMKPATPAMVNVETNERMKCALAAGNQAEPRENQLFTSHHRSETASHLNIASSVTFISNNANIDAEARIRESRYWQRPHLVRSCTALATLTFFFAKFAISHFMLRTYVKSLVCWRNVSTRTLPLPLPYTTDIPVWRRWLSRQAQPNSARRTGRWRRVCSCFLINEEGLGTMCAFSRRLERSPTLHCRNMSPLSFIVNYLVAEIL